MLNQHHPDDERLSALASRDDDATADVGLASHVESCARCTDLVTEFGALRMSLAELPDLRPPRPLWLVPPATDESVTDGAAGWIRRFFAPALTAGAALALVGVVGTAAPVTQEIFQNVGSNLDGGAAPGAEADGAGRDNEVPQASDAALGAAEGEGGVMSEESQTDDFERIETFDRDLPAERSPWPMVLFTGVALMIGAALLRWILVPRAG
jgi:hypothetical protein